MVAEFDGLIVSALPVRHLGLKVQLALHKIYIDKNLFNPVPDQPRSFDVTYNAELAPFKRHRLARLVPRSHTTVNQAYASAPVGFCLLGIEGAMHANMEYLLACLPVVSTPSRGDRHLLFQPDTTTLARDDPREVRGAVAALKARSVPSVTVRATTLRLVQRERDRFNAFVERLSEGHRTDGDPRWSFACRHKLGFRETMPGGLECHFLTGCEENLMMPLKSKTNDVCSMTIPEKRTAGRRAA